MKVLVTGAAGRVGSVLVKELIEHKMSVVGFDVTAKAETMDCAWGRGELTDPDALATAFRDCDSVGHLAAIAKNVDRLEVETCRANILGTVCLLDQAVRHKVSRVVAASSICAGGLITSVGAARPSALPITETFDGGADDMYGMSKRFGESLGEAFQRRYGLSMIYLRIASVSFPEDDEYADFMSQVFAVESDASALLRDVRWQYVDVRDVAQAIRLAVTNPAASGIYNVGAADNPGADWMVWRRASFPAVPQASLASAFVNDLAAPIWSIDRIVADLGFSPGHSWREYEVIVRGTQACKTRFA